MTYCIGMEFTEKPNYEYCKKLFQEHMEENKMVITNEFDWH